MSCNYYLKFIVLKFLKRYDSHSNVSSLSFSTNCSILFAGTVSEITTAGIDCEFEYKEEVEKGKNVWCIYLPTDTTKVALLKIDSIYQQAEE